MEFDYLLDKLNAAEFSNHPFDHIEIQNWLSEQHFEQALNSRHVNFSPVNSDMGLVKQLLDQGYQPESFPGCTDNIHTYLNWRAGKNKVQNRDTCEAFGMAFRLKTPQDPFIKSLLEFLNSEAFLTCLAKKFEIELNDVYHDIGLQKYLDGYEISPHPDVRRKALTYMLNINPDKASREQTFHTHYLQFRDERLFVQKFWEYNHATERCWVPWDWCETVKTQHKNNSIVLFSPSFNTLHAVKAHYDHHQTQRTQIYGNFWYHKKPDVLPQNWRDFEIPATPDQFIVINKAK